MILINLDIMIEGMLNGYAFAYPTANFEAKEHELNSVIQHILHNLKSSRYLELLIDQMPIIGLVYTSDLTKLKKVAVACTPKNQNPTASIATAYLTKLAQDNTPTSEWFSKIWEFCGGQDEDFDSTFRKLGHVLGWGSERHAIRHLGRGASENEIVTIVLYSLLRHPNDLEKALDCSNNAQFRVTDICTIIGAIHNILNIRMTSR